MALTALVFDVETLSDASDAWRQYLAIERGLAPRTVAAYVADLHRLETWLLSVLPCPISLADALQLRVLRAYVRHLGTMRLCRSAAIARTVASIKSLSSWAAREGAIAADIAADLQRPKVVSSVPSFLGHEDLSLLLAWTSTHSSSPRTQLRDHAILVLLAYSGARLSEVADFRSADLDSATLTVRLHGKGRKDRLVPIAAAACDVLTSWRRRPPPSTYLFLGGADGRLHVRTIERIVSRASRAALGRSVSPHTIRHSYATLLHRRGVALRDLQLLLGHASIATTQIYLHTAPRDLEHIRTIDVAGLDPTANSA